MSKRPLRIRVKDHCPKCGRLVDRDHRCKRTTAAEWEQLRELGMLRPIVKLRVR